MTDRESPIAVIAMALRAPGAETPEEFWANILAGRDTLTRATETQLRRLGVPERLIKNPMYIRSRPVLRDPGGFDAAFFDMSGRTAKTTDPGHRLFLTCAYEALERAGVVPGREAGTVGVFGGGGGGQDGYVVRNFGGGAVDLDDPAVWLPMNVGGNVEHLTSRVCFHLDLRGPNVTAMAACATSLLAVDLAVRALRQGDCDLALAGGAAVHTPHWPGYLAVDGGPVSLSGTVRPFDERADGTVFGSGVGVVVLKRLDAAVADGNHIHGVVLGTGIFNDGGQKHSLAAPAIDGQIAAISKALETAQVSAETIGFIEAHGTGTLVGDPIEVEATSQVYGRHTDEKQFCALGAVKANIGHAASAAGVLGLIKACLALEYGVIPPNPHFETPNPRLDLPATPFYIPTEAAPWPTNGQPRRAGVSAFGFGGNNAHVVLEAPPPQAARPPEEPRAELIVLSARTPTALDRQVERLADDLDRADALRLDDVAHTLQTGRTAFDHRAAVVASSLPEAGRHLSSRSVNRGEASADRPVIFALSGQGSQRAGMGQALYREDPVYQAEVDRCAELLAPHLGLDIRSLLHGEDEDATTQIMQTAFSQPGLFVVEYALARRLMAWGIEPAAMIGHSLGELVAACLAGVFSLPDALALIALRGRLMQACDPGSMMALFLSAAEAKQWLADDIEVAAFNAPDLTVVSGPCEAIEHLGGRLDAEGLSYRVLRISHGFHSQSMEPVIAPYREAVARVERSAPTLPFVSNVTGQLITAAEATDPDYWANHIRQPVRFAEGVAALGTIADSVWLEVGPGGALSSLIRRQTDAVPVIAALDGDRQDRAGLLDVLSKLWVEGVPVNWSALRAGGGARVATLPTYPFETQTYWIDPPVFEPGDSSDHVPPANEEPPENEDWLYVPAWREEPMGVPALSADEGWLIFEDGAGVGAELRRRILEADARVLSLEPGREFERLGPDRFRVRPGVADDLAAVMQEGAASGWTLRRIVHLWQVDGDPGDRDDLCVRMDACLGTGFETLTAMVKALYECGVDDAVDMTVAADGVAALDGEDGPTRWEKASLLGPCRVAPHEMPSLSCQLIDLPVAALSAPWLVEALLAEASAPEPGSFKALRNGRRYVETFRPLPELLGGGGMRSGSVALITGGTGGLGLEVAGRLFEIAQMRLALLTRWQPPPVEEWPERAKTDDRIGRALGKVLALQARGAQVRLVHGDAGSADDMARVVDEVRVAWGGIDGVVHAAGIVSPSLMLASTRERVDAIFGPKVKGALILEELLGEEPLEFFISFSSIASVVSSAGQADYAAANAVLDALAKRRTGSNWRRVCSISWGAWDGVGMMVDIARRKRMAELLDFADGPVGEPVEHPLWQQCRRENDRVLFANVLRPSEHWVVDEHRLDGAAVLPGTGILEMIHGAFQHLHGPDAPVAIRDVAFRRFVQVPDEGLEVWLSCAGTGDEMSFELRSCPPDTGGHRWDEMTLHTTGIVAALEESAPTPVVSTGEWCPARRHEWIISGGPHWKRLRRLESAEDDRVVQLSLADEYRPETLTYGLHPPILDFALSHVPSQLLKGQGVPSTIGELRIYRRLPPTVIAFSREVPNGAGAVSVVMTNEQGEVVAECDEYLQVRLSREPGWDEVQERRLDIRDVGDLTTLQLVPLELPPLGTGEVQIEIYAAGLNFRDVLTALGGLSDVEPEGALDGGECSGRIVAVGPGVEGFSVGDAVMAVVSGAFGTRTNADVRLVARKPATVSFEEAAGAPTTFLTAEYALNHLAHLAEGERVLIHAAAGGVGLAAIQIARAAGAEIYATAGSDDKRAYLRDLGVKHVMSSRTLDFVEEIRTETEGTGVDVVLNSLAGDFIPASLDVLRPFGRFLEIGKRDIFSNTAIGLRPFRNSLSFHAIDLGELRRQRHPLLFRMFGELVEALGQGRLKPGPVLAVPWQDARRAVEHMAAAQHIGKVVLVVRSPAERALAGATAEEDFNARHPTSIPLSRGLDIFQELLQRADLPAHVVASPLLRGSDTHQEAPTLQGRRSTAVARNATAVYRAPSNLTEEQIVEIWEQILSVDSIGVDDDFLELGGDSIAMIQISNRIRGRLGVGLSHTAIAEVRTPARLGEVIRQQTATA